MEVEKLNFQNNLDNFFIKKKYFNKIIIFFIFLFFISYCTSIIYFLNKVNYHYDIIHIINNKNFFSKPDIKNKSFSKLDKDMIGLEYPEIYFEKLRNGLR